MFDPELGKSITNTVEEDGQNSFVYWGVKPTVPIPRGASVMLYHGMKKETHD